LVGASVIAVTPIAPPPPALAPQVHVAEVEMPSVQLTASVADIFTFPIIRLYIRNQITDLVTIGVGLGESAAALGQSIAAIPGVTVAVVQQILSGDLLGALTTIETAVVGSIVAVGEPTLTAIIERRQRVLAVQPALQAAVPTAVMGWAPQPSPWWTGCYARPSSAAKASWTLSCRPIWAISSTRRSTEPSWSEGRQRVRVRRRRREVVQSVRRCR
jgi:hypothetical protein